MSTHEAAAGDRTGAPGEHPRAQPERRARRGAARRFADFSGRSGHRHRAHPCDGVRPGRRPDRRRTAGRGRPVAVRRRRSARDRTGSGATRTGRHRARDQRRPSRRLCGRSRWRGQLRGGRAVRSARHAAGRGAGPCRQAGGRGRARVVSHRTVCGRRSARRSRSGAGPTRTGGAQPRLAQRVGAEFPGWPPAAGRQRSELCCAGRTGGHAERVRGAAAVRTAA